MKKRCRRCDIELTPAETGGVCHRCLRKERSGIVRHLCIAALVGVGLVGLLFLCLWYVGHMYRQNPRGFMELYAPNSLMRNALKTTLRQRLIYGAVLLVVPFGYFYQAKLPGPSFGHVIDRDTADDAVADYGTDERSTLLTMGISDSGNMGPLLLSAFLAPITAPFHVAYKIIRYIRLSAILRQKQPSWRDL